MQPPNNLMAEQAVISSLLLDAESCAYALDTLKPADFYHGELGGMFMAAQALRAKNIGIDLVSLVDRLEKDGKKGLAQKLAAFPLVTYTTANIQYWVDFVYETSKRRQLIAAMKDLTNQAYVDDGEVSLLIDHAQDVIGAINDSRDAVGYVPIKIPVDEALDEIESCQERGGEGVVIPTPLTHLNSRIGGWRRGEYVLLAARPSMGKTAFALQVAEHAARMGRKVLIFSLEMSRRALAMRILSFRGDVNLAIMREGGMKTKEWMDVTEASEKIYGLSIWIDDYSAATASYIRARTRRLIREAAGLDMVIVDHIGLVKPENRQGRSRNDELAQISHDLKGIAKTMDVTMIALCQLSRKAVQDRDAMEAPRLDHLRDTGELEQDADLVIFIHRPGIILDPAKAEKRGVSLTDTTVKVAKQRNGPIGQTKSVIFTPATASFGDKFVSVMRGEEQ